jgi:hypothetical protein
MTHSEDRLDAATCLLLAAFSQLNRLDSKGFPHLLLRPGTI